MWHTSEPQDNEPHRINEQVTFTDGLLHPGGQPGLGVTLDIAGAGEYPYQTAYLPFNRLKDGTVHDW